MATIIKILIDGQTRSVNLESFSKDVISFGRSPECDIQLSKPYVSRLHGCFYLENGSWNFQDLDSVNGIYNRGVKKAEGLIREGDTLVLCTAPNDSDKIKISMTSSNEQDSTATIKGSDIRSSVSSINSTGYVSKPVSDPVKSFSGSQDTSKKTSVWVFVAIGLVVVIGLVALIFGLRKINNSDSDGNATVSDATSESGIEDSTVESTVDGTEEETTTEVEPETTEAIVEEPTEISEESSEFSEDSQNDVPEESYYTDDFQLTEYGAITGVKNYCFKHSPEMKENEDAQNNWSVTNNLIEDGDYEGCIEIEYIYADSENDSRTYYYVNKSSGDVAIEEYADGIRIKSSEKFNVNDYLD